MYPFLGTRHQLHEMDKRRKGKTAMAYRRQAIEKRVSTDKNAKNLKSFRDYAFLIFCAAEDMPKTEPNNGTCKQVYHQVNDECVIN